MTHVVVDMTTWREAVSGGMWKQNSGRTQASAELGLRHGGPDVSVRPAASEARDLGDVDRFQFYDHMKAYTAAPPERPPRG